MSADVLIDPGRMLHLIGIEGQLLSAATRDAHPDAPVPGVSGHTLGETVRYLGDLCEETLSWLDAVGGRKRGLTEDASLREATHWFTERLATLLAEFDTRPFDEQCPTWWPQQQTVVFWIRRMLHATTVSRVDVQSAAGVETTPIQSEVAVDGIDEIFLLWLGYRLHSRGITATRDCSVSTRVSGYEWHADITPDRATATRLPASRTSTQDVEVAEDAVVSGDPAAVYLWLWGRLPDRMVHSTGDYDAVAQLWSLLRLATR